MGNGTEIWLNMLFALWIDIGEPQQYDVHAQLYPCFVAHVRHVAIQSKNLFLDGLSAEYIYVTDKQFKAILLKKSCLQSFDLLAILMKKVKKNE